MDSWIPERRPEKESAGPAQGRRKPAPDRGAASVQLPAGLFISQQGRTRQRGKAMRQTGGQGREAGHEGKAMYRCALTCTCGNQVVFHLSGRSIQDEIAEPWEEMIRVGMYRVQVPVRPGEGFSDAANRLATKMNREMDCQEVEAEDHPVATCRRCEAVLNALEVLRHLHLDGSEGLPPSVKAVTLFEYRPGPEASA